MTRHDQAGLHSYTPAGAVRYAMVTPWTLMQAKQGEWGAFATGDGRDSKPFEASWRTRHCARCVPSPAAAPTRYSDTASLRLRGLGPARHTRRACGQKDRRADGWMDGWMHAWVDARTHGWLGAWVGGCYFYVFASDNEQHPSAILHTHSPPPHTTSV